MKNVYCIVIDNPNYELRGQSETNIRQCGVVTIAYYDKEITLSIIIIGD